MILKLAPSVGALLISLTAGAQAVPFDNLSQPISNARAVAASYNGGIGDGPVGASFTTPGGLPALVTDVKLMLISGGNDGGAVVVSIYDDFMANPNSLVGVMGSLTDALLPSSDVVTVVFTGSVLLQPSTRYWVVLSDLSPDDPNTGDPPANPTSAQWAFASTADGTGVLPEWYWYDNTSYANDFGGPFGGDTNAPLARNAALMMSVTLTTTVAAVPEPASLALLAVGFAGAACLRRRFRR